MPKLYVLKKNYEFRRAYAKGLCIVDGVLITYVFKKKRGGIKVGVTSGKKIGCAVVRNRARRVIRAAWRCLDLPVSGSYDIVFVARTRTGKAGMQKVREVMSAHLQKAGVVR